MNLNYRKKPVVIQALQLTENNIIDVYRFIHGENSVKLNCNMAHDRWEDYENICKENGGIRLKTMESDGETQIASFGDFIIKGVQGEFYPCKPDVFEQTYEQAEQMSLEEIKSNWTETDKIIYKTNEIKLKSLEAEKTKVIAKN